MISWELVTKLMNCFPNSVINHNMEFIAHIRSNTYFILKDCENETDVKCKVLERLSRPAYKTEPYNSKRSNDEFHRFILNGINQFLNTDFTEDDMEQIYTYLGNACNHAKTLRFIASGYDMSILERSDCNMDKYFEVKKGCKLYRDYFDYLEDKHKVVDAFNEVCKHFGIETDEFYLNKESFRIVPTKTDNEKFATMMKKTNYGEFKKNSEPCKMWLSLTKDIEHFQKPKLLFYFDLLGHRWKERLFNIGEKLYCSIESDGDISRPDFVTELKASEFYKIIEESE